VQVSVRGVRGSLLSGLVLLALTGCAVVTPPPQVAAPAPPPGAIRVYAVGDVAQCGDRPAGQSRAARTARLVPEGATVLMLGDAAYPYADAATLANCYTPTWGRHLAHTLAVAGNHDLSGGAARDFRGYFAVDSAGGEEFVAYERELGADWRLLVLDSNAGGAARDRQHAWLRGALAAQRPGTCLLVAWHAPLFSSGLHRGSGDAMRDAWQLVDRHGADAVLSGHEHFYEAFEPRDARGEARADGQGPRQFVVGTGGAMLYGFWRPPYASRARVLSHGVLELTLWPGGYSWRFVDDLGRVRDAGSARCRPKLPPATELG
jgi:3',5'-cyclic AMP phosphodiesterase CpdA